MKPACGVAFGFGNKLVSFGGVKRKVSITQVKAVPEIESRLTALELAMGPNGNIKHLCEERRKSVENEDGKFVWDIFSLSMDDNSREKIV